MLGEHITDKLNIFKVREDFPEQIILINNNILIID